MCNTESLYSPMHESGSDDDRDDRSDSESDMSELYSPIVEEEPEPEEDGRTLVNLKLPAQTWEEQWTREDADRLKELYEDGSSLHASVLAFRDHPPGLVRFEYESLERAGHPRFSEEELDELAAMANKPLGEVCSHFRRWDPLKVRRKVEHARETAEEDRPWGEEEERLLAKLARKGTALRDMSAYFPNRSTAALRRKVTALERKALSQ